MLVLGIETSQIPGTIALCRDESCLEERTLQAERRHAETLVPEIGRLLADHGFRPRDCEAIAVSEGPGSFTGLRIGVTCGKTLAYAIGAHLAAVPTLLAVAHNAPAESQRLFVISDAQRNQLFLDEFLRGVGGDWQQTQEIAVVDARDWAAERTKTDVVTGPALEKYSDLFQNRCRILPAEAWMPRAAVIAKLGERKIRAGESADLRTLQPFYLRKSAAEEKLAGK